MLYLLLLYLAFGQLFQSVRTKTANFCILPPCPKNGSYEVLEPKIPNLRPGDKLNNFTLEFTCDPGYKKTASLFVCFSDGTIYGEISECLPECVQEENNVMSCGAGWGGEKVRCFSRIQDVEPRFNFTAATLPLSRRLSLTYVSGGHSAQKQELPWHVGIYTKKERPYMQICGGSLVSKTVVISAAHCFWSEEEKQLPASDYAVAVGKLYRPWNDQHDEQAQKSDVTDIKIPPRFQGSDTNLQDDIAIVIVSTPFKYSEAVIPVCLDFDFKSDKTAMKAGNLGKVGGWGLTGEDGPASPVLKVVDLPVVPIDKCIVESDLAFKAYITSDKICAGYQNGTTVCIGDSGGGLVFLDKENLSYRYYLRGIVSGAPQNDHLCNTLAWATFTHVLHHEHFIRETISKKSKTTSALKK